MALTLEEISARIEIMELLYRYCRGVDRGDEALIASIYHDDGIDEHGPWQGRGKEFGAFLVPSMDDVRLIGQHHITNAIIALDGDTAEVESYFLAFHPEERGPDEPGHALVAGRYLDRFEQRDGAWKIARRTVVIDVARALIADAEWPGIGHFPNGDRREADPSATKLSPGFCSPR